MGNGLILGGLIVFVSLLWLLFRYKRTSQVSHPIRQEPDMSSQAQYNISIRRRRYWSSDGISVHTCPECGGPLGQAFQTYMLFVKHGREVDPFLTGNPGGYFCAACPVVVLDAKEFEQSSHAVLGGRSGQFAVAGIVNIDALPEDQRDAVFADDDTPIPLVEFLEPQVSKRRDRPRQKMTRKQRRALRHAQRKGRKKRG